MDFGNHIIPNEHIIIKTKHTYVFTNIRPFLPYHILVVPINKHKHIYDLSLEELHDLFTVVQLSTKSLQQFSDDFTVSLQDGPAAGQTVGHLHVHIIPRKANDLEDNDRIYAKGALDYSHRTRTSLEMKEEADLLRPAFIKIFEDNKMPYTMQ